MSSLLRAWYAFLALCLLTAALTAFVGRVPAELTAAVALPHDMLKRAGTNLRLTIDNLTDRRDLRAELERLTTTVATLEQEQRYLELEVQRLEQVLEVRRVQSPGVVATAPVIGGGVGPDVSRLIIGIGTSSGVQVGMPVTVPQGLVGIVTEVTANSAIVRTVVDPQSRVGVSVRDRGGQGVVVGDVADLLRVTRFIQSDDVQVGDLVETSSYGGLFPIGVLVGTVQEVLPPDPNDLRRSFLVRPSVDLATLREVVLLAPQ
ncbi:MAG TPA: rod shape-determining protein MreC [Trueperaceae bacterium]|nr:rod shape-determining protein MreC [Trueperaceae bacterium]